MITVFTPTYNRAHTLGRLFKSLLSQTLFDFEWIIIDDGSTDNTEELVGSFDTALFDIIYQKQMHGGKHRAINKALDIARGTFFFIVDSDDYLLPDSIAKISEWIRGLPCDQRICGVSGLRVSPSGVVIGNLKNRTCMKNEYVDAPNNQRKKYGLKGDKAEAFNTEVLRKYRFPEFDGEYFLTEGCVWDALARDGYVVRWYYDPIYVCDFQVDGLTNCGVNRIKGASENLNGYTYYIRQFLNVYSLIDCSDKIYDFNKVCVSRHVSFESRCNNLEINANMYFWLLVVGTIRKLLVLTKQVIKEHL